MIHDRLGPPTFSVVGGTDHFEIFSEDALGDAGVGMGRRLMETCEADISDLLDIFPGETPRHLPFTVYLNNLTQGASHASCTSTEINIGLAETIFPDEARVAEYHRLMLVAEVVEVLSSSRPAWPCGESTGEGLSRVLACATHPSGFHPSMATAPKWLDTNPRPDWVTETALSDTYPIAVGCSVLFLNWLHYSRGYAWKDIVARGGNTLAKLYLNLVGQNQGWSTFSAEMANRWPVGQPSGLHTDQPF